MENDTATLKDLMAALTKLNIVFTCDPAIVLLGIYSSNLQLYSSCSSMTKTGSTQDVLPEIHGAIGNDLEPDNRSRPWLSYSDASNH